jgi:hypothetical protein
MSLSEVLIDDISIYTSSRLVKAFSINLILENVGITTDVSIDLVLLQGTPGVPTILQTWKQYSVPLGKVYYSGTYFLSESNLNQISNVLNTEAQKYQLVCNVDSGVASNIQLVPPSSYSVM